jgi:hypothetical protein
MAKRIKVGSPVNDAESWGFDLLERELPSEWLLITNVELPASTGQLLEIDAIVFGDKAIYLLDIKGYSGRVMVDANVWLLDDRRIDNPLSKANQVARIYASRIREGLAPGEHAPWCQGMVFLTGLRGTSLSLRKSQETLSVFGPDDIIAGLTDERYVTSQYKHGLTASQRDRAIDVLGRLGRLPDGPDQIAGYNRIQHLGNQNGVEQWLATSNKGELRTDWILREVDLTSGSEESLAAAERIKDEYIRYQQLTGVPGVASCAPLISDGERLVLPVRKTRGTPLCDIGSDTLDAATALSVLRTIVSAFEQFESRSLSHVMPTVDRVFVDDAGSVTLLASADHEAADMTAVDALKPIWEKLAAPVSSRTIADWFDQLAESPDYSELRFLIAAELSGKTAPVQAKTSVAEGELLLGRYRLEALLEDRGGVAIWKARHEAGKFPLVCTVVRQASERWPAAQHRLGMLMQNFHPGVERVFDIEYLSADDIYLVNRAWVDGESLEDICDPNMAMSALITALEALGYLHAMDILHRHICPETILFQKDRAILIALSALPQNELADSMPGYVHESVAEEGWSPRADLWAMIKSFQDACGGIIAEADEEAYERLAAFVADPDVITPGSDYVAAFGLKPKQQITELPADLAEAWSISKGYMTFLTLDMLNDGQPRSRNQIVLNALRSRRISGNKTNRSSINATISRLKSVGVAEDYGKKVRLTPEFLEEWNASRMVG